MGKRKKADKRSKRRTLEEEVRRCFVACGPQISSRKVGGFCSALLMVFNIGSNSLCDKGLSFSCARRHVDNAQW